MVAITITRTDLTAAELRAAASRTRDAQAARRIRIELDPGCGHGESHIDLLRNRLVESASLKSELHVHRAGAAGAQRQVDDRLVGVDVKGDRHRGQDQSAGRRRQPEPRCERENHESDEDLDADCAGQPRRGVGYASGEAWDQNQAVARGETEKAEGKHELCAEERAVGRTDERRKLAPRLRPGQSCTACHQKCDQRDRETGEAPEFHHLVRAAQGGKKGQQRPGQKTSAMAWNAIAGVVNQRGVATETWPETAKDRPASPHAASAMAPAARPGFVRKAIKAKAAAQADRTTVSADGAVVTALQGVAVSSSAGKSATKAFRRKPKSTGIPMRGAVVFLLSPGNGADITTAPALLDNMPPPAGTGRVREKLGCIESLVSAKCRLWGRSGGTAVDHVHGDARFGVNFSSGVETGRATGIVVGRRDAGLRPEALHRGPGLDQRAVDREMVSDRSGATSRCDSIAAMLFHEMSVARSRSRFLAITVGTRTGSSFPRPKN